MQNDKILPCPFCGGEAETTFICDGRYNQIKCKTSKCIMNVDLPAFYKSKEEAIEHWNTRKPMERIVEQLEELEKSRLEMHDWQGQSAVSDAIEIVKGGVDNANRD